MTVATPEHFLEKLEELPEIKAFPAAASRLMSEFDDPDLTPKRIAEVITCDPAIAAHMLQVANSPLYGYSGQIRTVEHAVVVLGMRSIRNLVLTMAGAAVFSAGDTAMEQRRRLWEHSLKVATIGRTLSPLAEVPVEEAFLTGIFHDVGKLVILDLAADTYVTLDSDWEPAQRIAWEVEQFGIDHAELGMDCADSWGLPGDIAEAIGHHHDLQADSEPLSICCAAANYLAGVWSLDCHGVDLFVDADWLAQVEALERFGLRLETSSLAAVHKDAVAQFTEVLHALT